MKNEHYFLLLGSILTSFDLRFDPFFQYIDEALKCNIQWISSVSYIVQSTYKLNYI